MVFMLELDMSFETGHLVHGVVTLVTVQLFVFMTRLEVPKRKKIISYLASGSRKKKLLFFLVVPLKLSGHIFFSFFLEL